MVEVALLAGALLLVAACGAFVAAEFALISVNRSAVEAAAARGEPGADGVLTSLRSLSTQLSGAQVGITVTNLGIGFLAEPALAELIRDPLGDIGLGDAAARSVSVAFALVVATAVTMIFGELVPKNFAIAAPMGTARAVQRFQRGFTRATAYVIRFCNGTANAVLARLGIEPQEELASARSPEELVGLARHSAHQGTLAGATADRVRRSVELGDRLVRDIMVPRGRMVTVRPDNDATELIAVSRASGRSRFPVIDRDIHGTVVGTVHVRAVLEVPFDSRDRTEVRTLMDPPRLVPDSVRLDALLDTLREGGLQMAILVDEFGGTAGLATLEDVVEELVGEVYDEHDPAASTPYRAADGSWSLPASLRPDEAGDVVGVILPDDGDYDTLAGLVTTRLGRLAQVGDRVEVVGSDRGRQRRVRVDLDVREVDGHRIDTVAVGVHDVDESTDDKHEGRRDSTETGR